MIDQRTSRIRRSAWLLVGGAIVVVAPTVAGAASPATPEGTTVTVRLTDTRLGVATPSIAAASVTLVVRNDGTVARALTVSRIAAGGRTVVSIARLAPGASARRPVALTAGRYALTSTAAGGGARKLSATLVVRAAGSAASAPRPGDAANGGRLFLALGCGGCHAFAPAGTTGDVGQDLAATRPTTDRIVSMLARGGAGMPSFAERASRQEIADIAAYVTSANAGGDPAGG